MSADHKKLVAALEKLTAAVEALGRAKDRAAREEALADVKTRFVTFDKDFRDHIGK